MAETGGHPHAAPPAMPGALPEADPRSAADERLVARTLQAGLAIGLALLLVGTVVGLANGAFAAIGVPLRAIAGPLPPGARLTALGVLALGVTPAARVLLLLFLWTRERDWRFAAVAATVLVVLTASLLAGVG